MFGEIIVDVYMSVQFMVSLLCDLERINLTLSPSSCLFLLFAGDRVREEDGGREEEVGRRRGDRGRGSDRVG
jgi:hypothetical protein